MDQACKGKKAKTNKKDKKKSDKKKTKKTKGASIFLSAKSSMHAGDKTVMLNV